MRKYLMMLLFCCLATRTTASDDDSALYLFLSVLFINGVSTIYEDVSSVINYWTPKVQDPVCIDCGEPGKHANSLTKLPCGHSVCCLCKHAKVETANRHNGKFYDTNLESVIYPLCSCGKKFDFDFQEQKKSFESVRPVLPAFEPSMVKMFPITQITGKCIAGCGKKSSLLLECGHKICWPCFATQAVNAIQFTGAHAKGHCPSCNCIVSLDRFKDSV